MSKKVIYKEGPEEIRISEEKIYGGTYRNNAREKSGQGLDRPTIPNKSNMSLTHSEAPAANTPLVFRRKLLNELLDRKVMYEDIRTYRLSDLDIEYL